MKSSQVSCYVSNPLKERMVKRANKDKVSLSRYMSRILEYSHRNKLEDEDDGITIDDINEELEKASACPTYKSAQELIKDLRHGTEKNAAV